MFENMKTIRLSERHSRKSRYRQTVYEHQLEEMMNDASPKIYLPLILTKTFPFINRIHKKMCPAHGFQLVT